MMIRLEQTFLNSFIYRQLLAFKIDLIFTLSNAQNSRLKIKLKSENFRIKIIFCEQKKSFRIANLLNEIFYIKQKV